MDKSKQILKIARDRLGNQPTYNPVKFLEMCVTVRDELEDAQHSTHPTLLDPVQNFVPGCDCYLCRRNNPAFRKAG